MRASLQRVVENNNGHMGRVLDLSRFANYTFTTTPFPEPTAFMAALGKAIQLLQPAVLWVDLLHLTQLSVGKEKLHETGATALRSFFKDDANVATVGRHLISVCSAARSPMPIILNLGSPADWIRFYGEEPGNEIDDLDAEDIMVFLVNALQRVKSDEITALSFDTTHPIAGVLADTCASVSNYCAHQTLDFLVAHQAETQRQGSHSYRLSRFPNDDSTEHTAWRIATTTPPDQALEFFKTIKN